MIQKMNKAEKLLAKALEELMRTDPSPYSRTLAIMLANQTLP